MSASLLTLICLILASIMNLTSRSVRLASSQVESFQTARNAFDTMTQKLSHATLNTFWGYVYANGTAAPPTSYGRQSSLHFIVQSARQVPTAQEPNAGHLGGQEVFFQAPEGVSPNSTYGQAQGLLNACGYFVEYGGDTGGATWQRPPFITGATHYRYRLMQAIQPSEDFEVYKSDPFDPIAPDLGQPTEWVPNVRSYAWPLADNVIALVIWPREPLVQDTQPPTGNQITTNYLYDSRSGTAIQLSQLPPVLQVTMVVVDEPSMARLNPGATPSGAIDAALNKGGLFTLSDETDFQSDLYGANGLTTALTAAHVSFEVFNASIPLRESKWSSQVPSP